MKAEYINPFVQASFSVLEMVLGVPPVKGELAALLNEVDPEAMAAAMQ